MGFIAAFQARPAVLNSAQVDDRLRLSAGRAGWSPGRGVSPPQGSQV